MSSHDSDLPQKEQEKMTNFQASSLQSRYGIPVGSGRKALDNGSRNPK
uniref:Uncharacterized protein n=1 Tax=Propithecus coquereli TaxID=379532 RepID=A0A2K6ESJ8_PROCO